MEGYDANGDPLVQGIVEATGVFVSVGTLGEKTTLAQKIQDAMSEAVMDMAAKGITDPVLIKEAMMDARQLVIDETGG